MHIMASNKVSRVLCSVVSPFISTLLRIDEYKRLQLVEIGVNLSRNHSCSLSGSRDMVV